MDNNNQIIKSVDRALDILELLYQEDMEMGVTEISNTLNIYKSTAFRTLITLENRGYVSQNPENGKYWLGLRLFALGTLVEDRITLRSVLYPYVKELSKRFNEAVHVAIPDYKADDYPKHILILKSETHNQVLKVTPPVGSSTPCHCSSVGKTLLAFGEFNLEKYKGNPLPKYTDNTETDWGRLKKVLDTIREKGFAIDNEEMEIGLSCVAAPIIGAKGKAIAAISISAPTERMKAYKIETLIKAIKETAEKVSNLLR